MKYSFSPKNFFVDEVFRPKLIENGKYCYYLTEKKGLSHKQLKKRLPRDTLFCGVKDKNATTKQWFSSKQMIEDIEEDDLKVEYKGRCDEKIWIGKHKGNNFRILVEVSAAEAKKLKNFNPKKEYVANYFGKQRFDVRVNEFERLLVAKEFEEALKFFLCEKSKFDSEKSSEIKKEINEKWCKWSELVSSEKIPEAKKAIFKALGEGKSFESVFVFVEMKSFKQMLRAIQSKRWNELLHDEVLGKVKHNLNGVEASRNMKKKIILKENDFERRFGLRGLERESYFLAEKYRAKEKEGKFWIEFNLGKGCYATTFLEFLEEWLKDK